jgi:hypothetical protein
MRIVLAVTQGQWSKPEEPWKAIRRGLAARGHEVIVIGPTWPITNDKIDCLLVWNGKKRNYQPPLDGCRKTGTPVVILEAGFFDRAWRSQADWRGFNMEASWRSQLATPAPEDGADRFRLAWGRDPVPVKNRNGYVLILGQVGGDAQLRDAEIQTDYHLACFVSRCCSGMDVRLRRHPKISADKPNESRVPTIGGTLEEAIAGAAFVVTINSNSGNEALALGCPVLCFGPALYQLPGVTMSTTVATLRESIRAMVDGPEWFNDFQVNYLHWLACRQWAHAEFEAGAIDDRITEAVRQNESARRCNE